MWIILMFLILATVGSVIWTVVQVIKPEWFFAAENEANLKRKRPVWYLVGGILGILLLIVVWIQALQLQLTSVWILTGVLTLGSVKPLGMVFFYEKFSEQASKLVNKMNDSKKAYGAIVASRAVLSVVLLATTLYFLGVFGQVR